MKRIIRSASIILRTESLIAQRRLAVVRKQMVLVAFAGLIAVLGLVMLNVAAYQALVLEWGAPMAAFAVALANFVLAALLALMASRENAEKEIAGAIEVRNMAIDDLEAEIEGVQAEVQATVSDIRAIGRDPLGAATGLAVPLLMALLKSIGKSKS